jgi:hypothetical protein
MIGEEALQAFNRSTVHSGVLENHLERKFEAQSVGGAIPPGLLKAFESFRGLTALRRFKVSTLKFKVRGPCLKA